MSGLGYITAFITGAFIGITAAEQAWNVIPKTRQLEQGSADPSKLEVLLKDTDQNKAEETILKYGAQQYQLKVDPNGNLGLYLIRK